MMNHILGFPLKPINSKYPPVERVLKFIKSSNIKHMLSFSSTDCSEVAEKIYYFENKGAIIYYGSRNFEWPKRVAALNVGGG